MVTSRIEKLTCIQVWKRYNKASKKSEALRYKWKMAIDELHRLEWDIEAAKCALREIYMDYPNNTSNITIPSNIRQQNIVYFRNKISSYRDRRIIIHYTITMYKRAYNEATIRANRYYMAYNRLKEIFLKITPDKFPNMECTVETTPSGRLNVSVQNGIKFNDETMIIY